MRPRAYAPLVGYLRLGGRKSSGLFFNLDDNSRSAFEWLQRNPSDADRFINKLRAIVDDWQEARQAHRIRIGEMRRAQIGDEDLAPFLGELGVVRWQEVESTEIEVDQSLQHGDLHGLNIPVNGDGNPLLIDFQRSGDSVCCLDPIVLELSVLFHEQSPLRNGPWPSRAQCERWSDVDEFILDSPLREFVYKTRNWGIEVARSTEVFYATAYCHVLRQLKYPDTDKERALCIARSCVRMISRPS